MTGFLKPDRYQPLQAPWDRIFELSETCIPRERVMATWHRMRGRGLVCVRNEGDAETEPPG